MQPAGNRAVGAGDEGGASASAGNGRHQRQHHHRLRRVVPIDVPAAPWGDGRPLSGCRVHREAQMDPSDARRGASGPPPPHRTPVQLSQRAEQTPRAAQRQPPRIGLARVYGVVAARGSADARAVRVAGPVVPRRLVKGRDAGAQQGRYDGLPDEAFALGSRDDRPQDEEAVALEGCQIGRAERTVSVATERFATVAARIVPGEVNYLAWTLCVVRHCVQPTASFRRTARHRKTCFHMYEI
eukprot:scaffold7432_cov107-Isochrysis_galbana.AAC.9